MISFLFYYKILIKASYLLKREGCSSFNRKGTTTLTRFVAKLQTVD